MIDKAYKNISISTGTLRHIDIENAIYDFACEVEAQSDEDKKTIQEILSLCDEFNRVKSDSDDEMWIIEKLYDQMDRLAPKGCYFGAHPGDGADIGFWEIWEND